MISILYVTKRPGGFDILRDNLRRQTYQDFEVVIVDELYDWRYREVAEYFKRYNIKHIQPRPANEGDVWNINKAYNDGLDVCSGNYIISLQDYIWIPANGFQRFLENMDATKCITGCGHKYKKPEEIEYEGKLKCFNKLPELDGDIIEFDDRMRFSLGLIESEPSYFELNWAIFPKNKELRFSEEMDKFYGCDNIYLGILAEDLGMSIYVDSLNVCKGYSQNLFGRPENWEEKHHNKDQRFVKYLWTLGFRLH